jgi:hypothetical protein
MCSRITSLQRSHTITSFENFLKLNHCSDLQGNYSETEPDFAASPATIGAEEGSAGETLFSGMFFEVLCFQGLQQ